MPKNLKRYYEQRHLHFITCSCYRRLPLLATARRFLARSRSQPELFAHRLDHFWQKRFYDFNVYSERKRIEKLRYMHRNPVKRGLVALPHEWRWSSFRFYYFDEPGLLTVTKFEDL